MIIRKIKQIIKHTLCCHKAPRMYVYRIAFCGNCGKRLGYVKDDKNNILEVIRKESNDN